MRTPGHGVEWPGKSTLLDLLALVQRPDEAGRFTLFFPRGLRPTDVAATWKERGPGIAAATAVGASLIDTNKNGAALGKLDVLRPRQAAIAAEIRQSQSICKARRRVFCGEARLVIRLLRLRCRA